MKELLAIGGGCVFLGIAIAASIYQHKYQSLLAGRRDGVVIAGPHIGRAGVITNHCPFDLVVELNVAPTEQEIAERVAAASEANRAWVQENPGRSWVRVWRWQAVWTYRNYWNGTTEKPPVTPCPTN